MWCLSSWDRCVRLSTYNLAGLLCNNHVIHICLTFVDLDIEIAPTYKNLKPHMNFLVYKASFVNLTPEDIDLFGCDPHEFVQHHISMTANFYDPWMTSITLITYLVKYHVKDITQCLLGFLTEIIILCAFFAWVCSLDTSYKKKFSRT